MTGPDLILRKLGAVAYGLYGRPDQVVRVPQDRVYLGFDDSMPDPPRAKWLEDRIASEGAWAGLRSNDMATLIESARVGNGIALLPRFAAQLLPELVGLPDPDPFAPRVLHLVMHPDIRRAPRIRLVADQIAGHMRRALWWRIRSPLNDANASQLLEKVPPERFLILLIRKVARRR